MSDGADLTFEELDRVVQSAHTRKRKRKKSKSSKKTAQKRNGSTHKSKPKKESHKKADTKEHKPADRVKTDHPKASHHKKPTKSRSVARSARAMHAKKSAAAKRRVRRQASHKKADAAKPNLGNVAVKSVPSKKTPEPKHTVKVHKTTDNVHGGQSRKLKPSPKAKTAKLVTDTPPLFNRIGVDSRNRDASEVQVKVGRPRSKPPENPGLLNDLTEEKSSLPPHKPVGHVSSKSMESSLTSLYDDEKTKVSDESKAEAVEARYKAEHQPAKEAGEESSLGLHSSEHHRVQARKGWVTAFDHILNIVITTLFLVLVAFFIIVQLGWFDIGLDPVF